MSSSTPQPPQPQHPPVASTSKALSSTPDPNPAPPTPQSQHPPRSTSKVRFDIHSPIAADNRSNSDSSIDNRNNNKNISVDLGRPSTSTTRGSVRSAASLATMAFEENEQIEPEDLTQALLSSSVPTEGGGFFGTNSPFQAHAFGSEKALSDGGRRPSIPNLGLDVEVEVGLGRPDVTGVNVGVDFPPPIGGTAAAASRDSMSPTATIAEANGAGDSTSATIPDPNEPGPPTEDLVDLVQLSGLWSFPNHQYGIPGTTPTAATGHQLPDYVRLILTAQVYDVAIESPLQLASNLSSRLNNSILLKREDLQPVFSFKLRGAYNRMSQLTPEEMAKGVIACSAGNHAQGVALAASKMGIKATIVMPTMTPPIKWKNVKRLGASVVLYGNDFDEAKKECARLAAHHGYINIPPYDDPHVIAGQGTVGVEIIRQLSSSKKLDAIFVCVGGGGLAAGVASYVKRLYPHIKVIGVETYDSAAMTYSLLAGKRVSLPQVGLFADGAAVRLVGEETFRICKELLDGMVLVTTDEICAAIKDIFEDTRSVVEPAGALGLAGAKKYVQMTGCTHQTFVAVSSGANMNFDRLRFVAERAVFGENKEVLLTVVIPERPGAFADLYNAIYPRTVSEFAYRYGDANEAHIFMAFNISSSDSLSDPTPAPHTTQTEIQEIIENLKSLGMTALDATRNEMAKDHLRHLVGGRPPSSSHLSNERVFRFAFPERPGALLHFLTCLSPGTGPRWNVSLFHHRNYGGDVSRVLCGVQVERGTEEAFEGFLGRLGYPYVEETGNPVYQRFLR